ncbi:MAG: ABC transporter permease [bacterium]|nr:ABC transporter permease [bacterium]
MTTRTLALRVLPPPLVGLRAQRLIERNMLVYRRAWMIVVSGFFEPVFYLLSLGIGMGRLVGEVAGPGGTTISYAAFVAPALLAASAMNGAVLESTINIFIKLLRPWDIAIGEITWSLIRGVLYSTGFVVVMAVMGLVATPMAILAIPAATLIGFAFGAVGMAATTFMRSWQDFDLVVLFMLPLFLFSATFYPLDVYPPALQALTQLSPLYHGVELIRAFTLHSFDPGIFGHMAYLIAIGSVGLVVTGRRLGALLKP